VSSLDNLAIDPKAFLATWSLVVLFLMLSTAVCGIVCLFLKERELEVGTDVWIAVTLVLCICVTGFDYLPAEFHRASKELKVKSLVLRQADLEMYDLQVAANLEHASTALRDFEAANGAPGYKEELAAAETNLRKILDQHDNAYVAARLAIVVHERQGDVRPVLGRVADKEDPLIKALRGVYLPDTLEQPVDENEAKQALMTLPQGWYQRTALRALVPKNSPEYAALEQEDKAQLADWEQRFTQYSLFRLILVVLGLVVVVLSAFRWASKTAEPFSFPSLTFKKLVGGYLVFYSLPIYIAVLIGIAEALMPHLKEAPLIEARRREYAQVAVNFASSMCALLAYVYLVVCKPVNMKFKDFWQNSSPSVRMFFTVLIPGLCAAEFLTTAVNWLHLVILGKPAISANVVNKQVLDVVSSGDPLAILLVGVAICVCAPVIEETTFRGICYRWARTRWGVPVALIVSSALFAAAHLDFGAFWDYCAMGIVFAMVYERTRSLTMPILMHGIWNAWSMASTLWWLAR
jgi:membrane protease YdiL (CAAX protease family)